MPKRLNTRNVQSQFSHNKTFLVLWGLSVCFLFALSLSYHLSQRSVQTKTSLCFLSRTETPTRTQCHHTVSLLLSLSPHVWKELSSVSTTNTSGAFLCSSFSVLFITSVSALAPPESTWRQRLWLWFILKSAELHHSKQKPMMNKRDSGVCGYMEGIRTLERKVDKNYHPTVCAVGETSYLSSYTPYINFPESWTDRARNKNFCLDCLSLYKWQIKKP